MAAQAWSVQRVTWSSVSFAAGSTTTTTVTATTDTTTTTVGGAAVGAAVADLSTGSPRENSIRMNLGFGSAESVTGGVQLLQTGSTQRDKRRPS